MKKTFKNFLIERLVATDTKQVRTPAGVPASSVFKGNSHKSGAYSYVKDDKNDPHVVHKYQKKHNSRDAYWIFLDHLKNSDMMDNPYLPKVYKHTVVKDVKDNVKNSATIEKLMPLSEASPSDIFLMCHRAYGMEFEETPSGKLYTRNSRFMGSRYDENHASRYALNRLLETIELAVQGYTPSDNDEIITDEQLLEATAFVRKVMEESGSSTDMHSANFMLRRTPTGAQLVIIDPLWFEGSLSS